jgi:hypothetical protein
MLQSISLRWSRQRIFANVTKKNTVVILPDGTYSFPLAEAATLLTMFSQLQIKYYFLFKKKVLLTIPKWCMYIKIRT